MSDYFQTHFGNEKMKYKTPSGLKLFIPEEIVILLKNFEVKEDLNKELLLEMLQSEFSAADLLLFFEMNFD